MIPCSPIRAPIFSTIRAIAVAVLRLAITLYAVNLNGDLEQAVAEGSLSFPASLKVKITVLLAD